MIKAGGYDVLTGYYGFSNFGDDLFREILSRSLARETWSRVRISENRSGIASRYTRNFRAIKNILSARSVTLGGGSILGARPPFGIRNIELAAARLLGVCYTAVGVGILEGEKNSLERMLSGLGWVGLRSEAEYLSLRDQYSTVHYMSDLAYAAPQVLFDKSRKLGATGANGEVAIIPAAVGQLGKLVTDRDSLRCWLRGNLGPFVAKGKCIKVMLLQPQNERDAALCTTFAEETVRLGADVRTFKHRNPSQTLHEIGSSAFVFTDRLHGGIVAHVCGVPFRLSCHHTKCSDLLADIQHPDSNLDSYAADVHGHGNDAVENWTNQQSQILQRHSDLANEGISGWLKHLASSVA